MKEHEFIRTEFIIGEEGIENLKNKTVAVIGIGGVGGYAVEALARASIGNLILIDKDVVDISNLNRQIIATHSTIGKSKVELMKNRVLSINPNCNVKTYNIFIDKSYFEKIFNEDIDYIIDAMDTITAKIDLAVYCEKKKIKLISSLGAGNKMDNTKFQVSDIYKTSVCPVAKVMRRELKKQNVKKLKVVYSKEYPAKINYPKEFNGLRKKPPASISFVPPVCGFILSCEVVNEFIKELQI